MKKNSSVKQYGVVLFLMLFAMLNATSMMAQVKAKGIGAPKVADKEIVGVWVMSSMKFEGENKELINENYNQVKVYRANGEYACAEIYKMKDGKYYIAPHEYGKYTLKNGMYSEMGRKAIKFTFIDKEHFGGRWKNRIDSWVKVKNFPESLTQHIVDKCKASQASPDDMQKMMKQYIFGGK